MKFVIDEDVDAEVRHALIAAGHDAWLVTEAGRSGASDSDQVIYAHERKAVFITHDRELATSRVRMPIGRVVRLRCSELEAAELVLSALPIIVPVLMHNPDIVIVVSRLASGEPGYKFFHGTERRRRTLRE
jgi:predicted nuclease of predicted toxin-antitoxin system